MRRESVERERKVSIKKMNPTASPLLTGGVSGADSRHISWLWWNPHALWSPELQRSDSRASGHAHTFLLGVPMPPPQLFLIMVIIMI